MPTYTYECKKCGNEFELVLSFRDYEAKKDRRCPACGSKNIVQTLAPFYAKTSKKS
ncbi:MAG: zinc ribbon domain-containing protein [Deltaproteobacteria bacterium]|nr:MAG: zinc ribbon domain-containing protein [Deltaproteobacteria bacterium]